MITDKNFEAWRKKEYKNRFITREKVTGTYLFAETIGRDIFKAGANATRDRYLPLLVEAVAALEKCNFHGPECLKDYCVTECGCSGEYAQPILTKIRKELGE